MASAGNVEAAAALNPTATVQDEAVSQGLNPFGDSRSQRALLAKAIAGESLRNVRKRHDVADDPQGMDRVDENSSKEFAQLGLVQQHEQLMDTDYVLVNEYKNKRMMLADAMDSVYVNLAVVCIVFVDVVSILIYELQAPDEKDCFGRDFPEQEIITICCFSGYVLELLLRGFGNGWRQSYTLERKNADNIFDAAVILVSVIMGIYQSWTDRTLSMNCPESWVVCDIPQRPYTLDMDKAQDPSLCDLISGTQGDITTARTAATAIRTIRLILRIVRAVRMLIKARRIGAQITKVIRARVSKHSRRYQKLGFDLDLSYITTRMICMASPAIERLYTRAIDGEMVGVNDAFMMARFFATQHYDSFRVFNFCAEELGNYAMKRLFNQVKRMPVKEKYPPSLADVLIFCENSAHFLFTDEKKVLILHCDSGRDRSGVFAASFLLYAGHSPSAAKAIKLFTLRRTGNERVEGQAQHALQAPSLTRVVNYVEAVINGQESFAPVDVLLTEIRFSDCRKVKVIKVTCGGVVLLDSSDKRSVVNMTASGAQFPPILIQGDTRVAAYADKTSTESLPDFCVHFHTAFTRDRESTTFRKGDIDFVAVSAEQFSPNTSIELIFSTEATPALKTMQAFRSAIETKGRVRRYRKGDVIVDRGELLPSLRLVLEGHISEVVPKRVVTSSSGSTTTSETEPSTSAIYGPGQIFALFALCIGVPDCRCVCTSRECVVAELGLELLVEDDPVDPPASEEGADPEAAWQFPGVSADELPGLLKVLCQKLAQRAMTKDQTQLVSSKETIFDRDLDTMMERVRSSAVTQFKLPAHEECVHVHRCEVIDGGGSFVADRVIFMTSYLILDKRMRGESIIAHADDVFNLDELSSVNLTFPDVTNVSFTIRDSDYEARCGSAAHARDFIARLEQIRDAKHFLFRRLAKEQAGPLDKFRNSEPVMTQFLDTVPLIKLGFNETVVEAGSVEQGILYVVSGSLMLLDDKRVVKVVRAGEYAGIHEYMLSIRTQYTIQVRSEDGCIFIRLPRPLLNARLKANPPEAVRFFQIMAKLLASQIYFMLIKEWPTAVFAQRSHLEAAPGSEYLDHEVKAGSELEEVEDEDLVNEGKKTDAKQALALAHNPDIVRLLKLRKTEFMKHLDEAAVNIIARGVVVRKLTAGTILIREGDKVANSPVDCMYLIIEGKLEVYVNGLSEDHLVSKLGRGEIVGERGLFLQEDRSATVKAKGTATIGAINIAHVHQLTAVQPRLVDALRRIYKRVDIQGLSAISTSLAIGVASSAAPKAIHSKSMAEHRGIEDDVIDLGASLQGPAQLPSTGKSSQLKRLARDVGAAQGGARDDRQGSLDQHAESALGPRDDEAGRQLGVDAPAMRRTHPADDQASDRSGTPQEDGVRFNASGMVGGARDPSGVFEHRVVELAQLGVALGIVLPAQDLHGQQRTTAGMGAGIFIRNGPMGNSDGQNGNSPSIYERQDGYYRAATGGGDDLFHGTGVRNGHSRMWSPDAASLHSFHDEDDIDFMG